MKNTLAFLLAALSCHFSLLAQSNASGIGLLKKTLIGGEGGWDYIAVSTDDRRLYLSHATQVEVLNADTHEKIGIVPGTKGVHGICPIPSLGKGFITNGKTNNVTVFDLTTLKTISTLPAGENPDALLYDTYSNRVFIFNNDSRNITVIDAPTNNIIRTFDVGGNPETGVTDGHGTIYVNLEDANEIVVFDSRTLAIQHRFALSPGQQPTGLAFDKKNHRLFSVCRKSQLMMVLDADNGRIVAQLPIGKGVDGAIFDDHTGWAVCSNSDGTLTVVKEYGPGKFGVIDTINTQRGAKTLAFDNRTGHLFTVTAQLGETPPPTADNPKPKPAIVPGTFTLLEYGKK
ncbi:YncE family protein [Flavitalea sp. BT771]|uniref:YncE family protein n=1 Tax=Flavitalea sp. BT771 TaxID=3063329 RepID=UPI0026E462AA|nr:YncE family protein [Flavitalea sp. BT771]MDO6432851.1 YncE family protein [Flavitalea sp. BT771]MDV6221873.1 YncE family protein [Flavitalea sp. BT771]